MAVKQHLDLVDDPLCVYPACTSQVLCHCGSGTSRQRTQGAVVLVNSSKLLQSRTNIRHNAVLNNNREASPLCLELLHDLQKGVIDVLVVGETVFDFPQITQCVRGSQSVSSWHSRTAGHWTTITSVVTARSMYMQVQANQDAFPKRCKAISVQASN